MKITYDPKTKADAAYIQLTDAIRPGDVAVTVPCDSREVGGMIHLDFDAAGVLIGIEIVGATAKLPPELLDGATFTK